MGQNAAEKNRDDNVSTEKKLDDLYKLIDGIETAMLTTRRADGSLVSRAMQTQKRTLRYRPLVRHRLVRRQARRDRPRSARQRHLLQGPHTRLGLGVGEGDHHPRSRPGPRPLQAGLEGLVPERGRRQGRRSRRPAASPSSSSRRTRSPIRRPTARCRWSSSSW